MANRTTKQTGMSRHKWEPIGLRGRIKECKICGCIKRTTNLMPEYTMPNGSRSLGKAPKCKKPGQQTIMKQWEYKVIKFKGQPGTDQEHDMLSEQGANGWELCTIYIGVMYYYFKRQLP